MCLETFQILDYCKGRKIGLAFECDVPKPPEVSNDMIRFNGFGGEGHETFIFFKKKPEEKICSDKSRYFYFCKTARKPYDLAVCLVLLSLANHAPKSVELASDGRWEDEWAEARKVYKELFGVESENFQCLEEMTN